MACWPICIGPMAPMPPTGAPVGRGPMPMAPGPPPTPVRLVRAFMGSSRRQTTEQVTQLQHAGLMKAESGGDTSSREQTAESPAESRTTPTYLDHPGPSYLWTYDRDAVRTCSCSSCCSSSATLTKYSRMSRKWMINLATRDKYSSYKHVSTKVNDLLARSTQALSASLSSRHL